jgi:hypothetical protein
MLLHPLWIYQDVESHIMRLRTFEKKKYFLKQLFSETKYWSNSSWELARICVSLSNRLSPRPFWESRQTKVLLQTLNCFQSVRGRASLAWPETRRLGESLCYMTDSWENVGRQYCIISQWKHNAYNLCSLLNWG